MRLWDWKRVRVGECKAGRPHLLTFPPESSANTPATTHSSPKLVQGGHRGAGPDAPAASPALPQKRRRAGCWTAAGWSLGSPPPGPLSPSLHPPRAPAGSQGLAVGPARRDNVGSMDGEAEGPPRGCSMKADGEQEGGEKLCGLSQAGAGLSVGGIGSGAKDG